jgi:hypothetical protein
MWPHLVDLPWSGTTEDDRNIGEYCVRRLSQEPDRVRAQQHNKVQLAVLILPDKEITLLFKRIIRLIDGVQVLPVELDLEARIRVQCREDQISHDYRTRMGLSEFVDHENVFSSLALQKRYATDQPERGQDKPGYSGSSAGTDCKGGAPA